MIELALSTLASLILIAIGIGLFIGGRIADHQASKNIKDMEARIAELIRLNDQHRELNALLRQELADMKHDDFPYICTCGEVVMNPREKAQHICSIRK